MKTPAVFLRLSLLLALVCGALSHGGGGGSRRRHKAAEESSAASRPRRDAASQNRKRTVLTGVLPGDPTRLPSIFQAGSNGGAAYSDAINSDPYSPFQSLEKLAGATNSASGAGGYFGTVSVPMTVRVVLVGLDGDGAHAFRLDTKGLSEALKAALPRRELCTAAEDASANSWIAKRTGAGSDPSQLELGPSGAAGPSAGAGRGSGRCNGTHALPVSMDVRYDVRRVAASEVLGFEKVLESKLLQLDHEAVPLHSGLQPKGDARGGGDGTVPAFDLPVERIEPEIDRLYKSAFGSGAEGARDASASFGPEDGPNTVIILNPSKKRMRPVPDHKGPATEDDYQYRYVPWGGARTQSWVGAGRYVVVDLSAGPVSFGSSGASEGTVCATTYPRLGEMIAAARSRGRGDAAVLPVLHEFRARLSSLVISAVRHVFAPDTRYRTLPPSKKVLVSIIVLKNHNAFDPLASGRDSSVNVRKIKEELTRMLLPGQELTVLAGVHGLHDHRLISMAVSKALRTDATHEVSRTGQYVARLKPYLDSRILYQELRDQADVLAAGVMTAASPLTKRTFFNDDVPNHPSTVTEDHERRDTTVSQAHVDEDEAGADYEDSGIDEAAEDGAKGPDSSPEGGAMQRPRHPRSFHRSHGVRVLPVYVVSLTGLDADLLLDRRSLMSVHQDAVIVLQTDADAVRLPYRSENRFISAHPRDPTRQVIAGVATALGGLLPPHERFSAGKGRLASDFTWANGHHPFGPFANASRTSQVMADIALRNNVIARLDAALRVVASAMARLEKFAGAYMLGPFGTRSLSRPELLAGPAGSLWVDWLYESRPEHSPLADATIDRLHYELNRLDLLFEQAASELNELNLGKAYALTGPLKLTASAFERYVSEEIEVAERNMQCFELHNVGEKQSGSSFAIRAVGGSLALGVAAYYAAHRLIVSDIRAGGRRQ